MRAPWLPFVVFVALLLAGCTSDAAPRDTEAPADVVYSDDRIQIERIVSQGPLMPPTLERAPDWRLGEWWRIQLFDDFVDTGYESTRVVAGAEKSDYLVGMPTHDFSNDLMVFHVPGFGQVNKTNLGFEVHDCPFQPLQFPLVLDDTWETQFECRDVTATVDAIDGLRATIHLVGAGDNITVVYDAAERAIVHFQKEDYATYKVVDHGFAFDETFAGLDGLVTVPHEHDVIFQHGRVAGALWSGDSPVGLAPYPSITDTVAVDSMYDRVSFAIILGNLFSEVEPDPSLPSIPVVAGGYYKEVATAPDGTSYTLEMLPDHGAQFHIETHKHDAPGGDWTFEHTAAGPGIAMSEGIAYHVYDVELPGGRILPSIGEHQHGGEGHRAAW